MGVSSADEHVKLKDDLVSVVKRTPTKVWDIHVIEYSAAAKACQVSSLAWKMPVVYDRIRFLMLHNHLSRTLAA